MGQVIFYIILTFLLYKFVFNFLIPVIAASRKVRTAMKDMRERAGQFENQGRPINPDQPLHSKSTTKGTSNTGDYIDFEEIK